MQGASQRGRQMSRIVVLAIVLALGSSVLSAGAFARSRGYGGGGGGDRFRGDHFGGGFGGVPDDGNGGYANRASGPRDGLRGYVDGAMLGHWVAYYEHMILTI